MGAIAASFNDKSEPKSVISNGIKISGEKYMTIEASDDSLKAKKVRNIHHPLPTTVSVNPVPQTHTKQASKYSPTHRH